MYSSHSPVKVYGQPTRHQSIALLWRRWLKNVSPSFPFSMLEIEVLNTIRSRSDGNTPVVSELGAMLEEKDLENDAYVYFASDQYFATLGAPCNHKNYSPEQAFASDVRLSWLPIYLSLPAVPSTATVEPLMAIGPSRNHHYISTITEWGGRGALLQRGSSFLRPSRRF